MRFELRQPAAAVHPTLTLVARQGSPPWEAREPSPPWGDQAPSDFWEAHGFDDLVPPATLPEARAGRDELSVLLGRERTAAADFLLTLADFDRRRGWERLGHASLFSFLTRELGLSSGAAQLRLSAARLLPRHPAVEAALRSGRLCISAVGQLARVLTTANEAAVLPRFLGCSAREAQEVAAALLPCPTPPRRELVTVISSPPRLAAPPRSPAPPGPAASWCGAPPLAAPPLPLPLGLPAPIMTLVEPSRLEPAAAAAPLHTYEVAPPSGERPRPAAVEPLTAELRRLHLTVSRTFLEKVTAARAGLSHTRPGATTEQVLEMALELLLEKQARRNGLVRRPREAAPSGRGASPRGPARGVSPTAGRC